MVFLGVQALQIILVYCADMYGRVCVCVCSLAVILSNEICALSRYMCDVTVIYFSCQVTVFVLSVSHHW